LRRLLGEDDLDVPAEERARQRHLLLVAAGQGLHRLLDRRHPDAEAVGELVDRAALTPSLQDAQASQPPQNLDRRVGAHAQDREERLPGSIAAEQHDAGAERTERRFPVELVAAARGTPLRALDARKSAKE